MNIIYAVLSFAKIINRAYEAPKFLFGVLERRGIYALFAKKTRQLALPRWDVIKE